MPHESVDRLAATEAVLERTGGPGEPLTTREVADALELTRRSAYERLRELADNGAIETKKVGARGRVWWRPAGASGEKRSFSEAIIDAQTDLVYAYDTDRHLTRWNEHLVEVLGYDPEELTAMRIEDFVVPAHRDEAIEAVDNVIDDQVTVSLELPIRTADGEVIPYEVSGAPITDEDGDVVEIAGIGRDVSDRIAREAQLTRERDFSDQLIEAAPASIVVFDADGNLVRANERASQRLGFDADEASEARVGPAELDVYDADGELVPPAERPAPRAFRTGEPVLNFHCQIDMPVGGMQWLSTDAIPLGDGEEVDRVLVAATDISELKHRTEQLERERATLATELEEVFARVDDAIVALDHEFRFTFVNDRAGEILGQAPDDLLGRELVAAFPDLADSRFLADCERAMATQSPVSLESHYDAIDSWLETTVYPSETGVSVYFRDVSDRKAREQAVQEQRERLAALHNLNGVVRDINEAVLQQSTRADIERLVCERIAATESYEFAWIGEGDAAAGTIDARVEAGVEGYVEDVPLSTKSDEPAGRGPAGRALRTGETQVSANARSDPRFAPWHEYADGYGFRAVAAIPIIHEDTIYGVLCIYADRSGAFTDEERAVVSHLGEVVGSAIAGVERKRALMSDEVVELELFVPTAMDTVETEFGPDERISFDQTVPVGEDAYVVYGTTTQRGLETMVAVAPELPHWESVTELFEVDDGVRYELRLSEPPVISAIASNGGSIASAAIEDGEYHVVVHLPTDVDVRGFVDAVGESAPNMALVARRQITRDRSPEAVAADLAQTLTERQRATLEASYHAGYFEWPREHDGNEVAETLDISPPTFHQHLRSAQRKLLEALLD